MKMRMIRPRHQKSYFSEDSFVSRIIVKYLRWRSQITTSSFTCELRLSPMTYDSIRHAFSFLDERYSSNKRQIEFSRRHQVFVTPSLLFIDDFAIRRVWRDRIAVCIVHPHID